MHRIGIIRGSAPDGGRSLDLALGVLADTGIAVATTEFDIGADRYLRTGELLPPDVLAGMVAQDALLSGGPPGNHPTIPSGVLERGITFGLRSALDLAVNLRVFRGVGERAGTDVAVVRENSEGAYSVDGVALHRGTEQETATDVSITTYAATRRCVRFAFDLARSRAGRVTLAHKTKVLVASGAVWERATRTVAAEYGDVRLSSENVDTLCARLVTDPGRYDVIVTDNVFGDIVSDVAAAATGATAYSASAELTTRSGGPSLFEPIHGPQDVTPGTEEPGNPLGALSAVAMMLRHLGDSAAGDALRDATLELAGQPAGSDTDLVAAVAAAARARMKEKH